MGARVTRRARFVAVLFSLFPFGRLCCSTRVHDGAWFQSLMKGRMGSDKVKVWSGNRSHVV